jgi:hypothetical protein
MKAPRAPASLPHDEQAGADSVESFAKKHGLSPSMVWKQIANGHLIARKCGSRTLITSEDAAAWRRALPRRVVTPTATAHREATRARTAAPDRPRRQKGNKHGLETAQADDQDEASPGARGGVRPPE